MPKASIIIPTYNSAATVEETITSVQNQTLADWELIIIDDGSEDETIEVVQNICEPRLKLFTYANGGVSTARNRGISHAEGEYLTFLDADDLWTRDKLASQIAALKNNISARAVYSWTHYISEKGKILFSGVRSKKEGNIYQELLQRNFLLSGSNILIHRDVLSVVQGFNPQLAYAADWDFYLRVAKNFNFAVVPKYQILYRQSANSMSSKIEKLKAESLLVLEQAFVHAPGEFKHLSRKSHSILYLYCAELYSKKNVIEKQENFLKAKQNLTDAVTLNSLILLQFKAQKTIVKLILLQFFHSALGNSLLKLWKKIKNKSLSTT